MEAIGRPSRTAAACFATGAAVAAAGFLALQTGLSWLRWSDTLGLRAGRELDHVLLVDPFGPRCVLWNWTSAVSSLRNLSAAQAQFRDETRLDEDRDGRGEYGTLAEMSGQAPIRGTTTTPPAPLSGAFRRLSATGEVSRAGYQFRVFLVGRDARALGGGPGGVPAGAADPDASETRWCAYAWPTSFDRSGVESFCITADGSIWKTEDDRYDGAGHGPAAGAVFPAGGLDGVPGASAEPDPSRTEHIGQDGNVWRRMR